MWTPLFCALTLGADPSLATLDARLAQLTDAHKGRIAIAVKHLDTGETYYLNADAVMPAADLLMVAVMIETYHQAAEGKLKLTDLLTLRDEDKLPGRGLLAKHFSAGATFSVRDAVHLMMAVSDRTAANLLLARIGSDNVNRRMEAWGLKETRLLDKALHGSTTAREMAKLMEDLQTGDRFRPALKQSLLGHLHQNEDRAKFPRLLPPDTTVGHRDSSSGDAGIMHTPTGPVVVVVLTAQNDDAGLLCARVALAVYEHFQAAPAKPGRK